MKQQFQGLQHCKCGVSWIKNMGFFQRTTNMKFCLERRKTGKKTRQCPVIRYTNEPGQPVGKPGKKLDYETPLSYMESQFAFIAGYTSGGIPYGITWDELEPERADYDDGDDELPF